MAKSLILACVIVLCSLISKGLAGVVTNVNIDPKCVGATLLELRLTDCTKFPCTIQRGKNYTVDADIISTQNLTSPKLKCGTIYLGRQHNLPGYGGCETITNGTCPLEANVVYNTMSSFVIPYYVPPIHYNIACTFEDDSGNPILCGSGSGRVV